MNLKERPSQVFVSLAGGNTADVFCDIETDLFIDSDTYSVVFHVVPGLQHHAVISRDFLRKQPEVRTARCCVEVDNHTIPVRFANVSDHLVVIKRGTAIGHSLIKCIFVWFLFIP